MNSLIKRPFCRLLFTQYKNTWLVRIRLRRLVGIRLCRTVARKFSIRGFAILRGGLCVCAGGLDIIKLTKTPLIYSVSRLNFGGLELCLRGDKPTKAPPWRDTLKSLLNTNNPWNHCRLLAAQESHTAAWSKAFPIASVGNLLSPDEFRIAIAFRTGAKILES